MIWIRLGSEYVDPALYDWSGGVPPGLCCAHAGKDVLRELLGTGEGEETGYHLPRAGIQILKSRFLVWFKGFSHICLTGKLETLEFGLK